MNSVETCRVGPNKIPLNFGADQFNIGSLCTQSALQKGLSQNQQLLSGTDGGGLL